MRPLPLILPVCSILLLEISRYARAALAEPPAGKLLLGMWPQSDPGFQETPASINERTGVLWGAFQYGQSIPLKPYDFVTGGGGPAPIAYIAATGTDAEIFLTVYPDDGLDKIQNSDILALAVQIRTYQAAGRTVFLRWAPEFAGNWMPYGLKPTAFVAIWKRMHDIIKTEAPDTVIVWSPNVGYSYPYGARIEDVELPEDKQALDTNRDGQLTRQDDPYSPYFPGDEYVDWIGLSLYYKGPDFVNQNTVQPPGFFHNMVHGQNPFGYNGIEPTVDWYQTYCVAKPDKACLISEAGAVWHMDPRLVASADNSQVEIQRGWWNDVYLNASFREQHPRIKAYFQFEFHKTEFDGSVSDERDYRISNNSEVLSAFQSDFAPQATAFVLANATVGFPPNTTAFLVTPSGPVLTATATVDQTTVITATYTQFYSGPFVDISYVATADPLAAPTGGVGALARDNPRPTHSSLFGGDSRSATICSASLVGIGAIVMFGLL